MLQPWWRLLVSCSQDDLCVDIWISVTIIDQLAITTSQVTERLQNVMEGVAKHTSYQWQKFIWKYDEFK